MTAYMKLSTSEYPLHEGDIRLEYPEITEDQTGETFPCPDTYVPVVYVEPPQYDVATQIVREISPTNIDGIWYTAWEIHTLTEEELAYIEQYIEMKKPIGLRKKSLEQPGSAPDVIG
jgi:hypothetical protein